jgi:hypothetical protein
VRVQFLNSGGPAFLRRLTPPVTIDVGTLAEQDGRMLEQLVRDARFFELPSQLPTSRGADDPIYRITIEDRGRQHTITLREPVAGPALKKLVAKLRELGTARGQYRSMSTRRGASRDIAADS